MQIPLLLQKLEAIYNDLHTAMYEHADIMDYGAFDELRNARESIMRTCVTLQLWLDEIEQK